jgi:predicted phosphodiesterase
MQRPPNKPPSRPVPASEPMAFISDIHGNLAALDAVLEELGRQRARDVFVAGDLLLGGDEPLAVWRKLQSIGANCVAGPSDVALAHIDAGSLRPADEEQREKVQAFVTTRTALGELVLKQLAQLPRQLRIPMIDGSELLLVHGSPKDPFETIGHELDDEEMLAMLGDDPADVIVCGGTHIAFARRFEAVQVINVGSVGASPEGRVAHYTIVHPSSSGSTLDQSYVEY